ncbi:MAG: TetR family transcriptional regulator [Pseudomonadales bacterium]|nr:TetR family transcriptional regulator [Pseudomonadales bacterium]MCP5214603.1 TetR family transcriptional regulator [Pseudomonadales bacterium]
MTKLSEKNSRHTRLGTAQRDGGKATAMKLIKTAHEMLMKGAYADFTMRNIAKTADVRLANLQYYFPKKEDLILALMHYVGELYDNHYIKRLKKAGDNPLERFEAAIEFNLDDIYCLKTRHFFIQFWPLIAIVDNYSGKLLSEFYIPQLRQFEELVKELDANAEDNEVQRRANMIIALIEGLMVVASPPGKKEQITFRKNVLQQCLSIARGI